MIHLKRKIHILNISTFSMIIFLVGGAILKSNLERTALTSLLEVSLLFSLYMSISTRKKLYRLIKLFFGLITFTIIIVQAQFIFSSNYFILPIAIDNIKAFSASDLKWTIWLPFIPCVFLLVFNFLYQKKTCPSSWKKTVFFMLLTVSLWSMIKYHNSHSFDAAWEAPVYSLASAIRKTKINQETIVNINKDFTENKEYYTSLFRRKGIYGEESAKINLEKPNIIIFFTEGMSARFIGAYGSKYRDLTPNIDEFYKKSLVFENYYNHAAATFRGLRGQLVSGYQFNGGYYANGSGIGQLLRKDIIDQASNKSIVTLPDILKNHGYDTNFVSADPKESQMDFFLQGLRFNNVYMSGDFTKENGLLQDKQFFDALWATINKKSKDDMPFMIAAYNVGTHANLDSPDLKYKEGSNIALNRFHNYDALFGQFMKKFYNSSISKNTIIIFTTDHASFAGPEITDADTDASPYFVDKIPLMIYYKGICHDIKNAKGRNSITISPTILNMLGIMNDENYFIGCSLFAEHCAVPNNVSALGDEYYITDEDHVYSIKDAKAFDKEYIRKAAELVNSNYRLTSD